MWKAFVFISLGFLFSESKVAALGEARRSPPISDVLVEVADTASRTEIESLFRPFVGKTPTPGEISAAIKVSYSRASLYTLVVTESISETGRVLQVKAVLRPTIHDIAISGNQAIDADDLLAQVGIGRNESGTADRVDAAVASLKTYYGTRGYLESDVEGSLDQPQDAKEATLKIVVREGAPCRINEIELRQVKAALPEPMLRDLLGIEAGDRCDALRVAEGSDRVRRYLRKVGRLGASISNPEFVYSSDRKAARLVWNLDPGSKFLIRFYGNTYLFERRAQLEKAIGLEDEKQFSSAWVESTALEGILDFYRSRGYAEARVTASDRYDASRDVRVIDFQISRGRLLRLRHLAFPGASRVSSAELEKAFRRGSTDRTGEGKFVLSELERWIDGLVAHYQSKGFLRIQADVPKIVKDEVRARVDVEYPVVEGEPSFLAGYVVEGNHRFSREEIEKEFKLRRGEPIDPVLLSAAAERLRERYQAEGFKFARVTIPAIESLPPGEVAYRIRVEEGPIVKIGNVYIRGNLHTNEIVVRRELVMREGDLYSPDTLRESRRNLIRLGFFESVTIEETNYNETAQTEDLIVRVQERKKRSIAFSPGFSTDDGARGQIRFGHLNIAGTGRNAAVAGRVSRQIKNADILEYHVLLGYQEPHLLGLASGRFNFIQERSEEQQFDIDRRSLILALDRNFWKSIRSTAQWELEFRNPFNVEPGVKLSPLDEERARFGSLATIVDWDFRDNLLNPENGTFHRLQVSMFNRSFLSDADFYQVYLKNSFFLPIYKRLRSVLSLRGGISATYGRTKDDGITEIPIEKRFRLGGSNTLRGFSRNCVGGLPSDVPENCSDDTSEQAPGGNAMINYMFDILIPVTRDFDFAIFTDGGNAFLANDEVRILDIRTSAGVGIRYNTFFGPLRLDFGVKLDRRTGESLGELHFAVGQL